MSQVQEFLSVLVKNAPVSEMSADVLQGWIENPSSLQGVLRTALVPPSQNNNELKVWKTIKLGVGPTNADDFLRHMKNAKINIGDWANDMMSKSEFIVSTEEREVDLVIVSVAGLGFNKGARRDQIYAKAKKLGLELCSSDVGPQLRLQYRDQPKNEWLLIGMEPITDSVGDLNVFDVGHDDYGLCLEGGWSGLGDVWNPFYLWVFVRPRK